ncbi:hypothetical protein H9P43_002081 [Blastocladiella emersonii ATCC 22665]|nr:hypothetical protein H9P43_002081 [Blastocladiella emersonii ATCC 22665]
MKNRGPSPGFEQSAFYLSLLVVAKRCDLLEEWSKLKVSGDAGGSAPLCLVDIASSLGYLDVLNYLESRKLIKHYTECAIDEACGVGHLDVLHWWKRSSLPLKATVRAYEGAIALDNPAIVDWIFDTELERTMDFEPTVWVPIDALEAGSFKILRESKLVYTEGECSWMHEMNWESFVVRTLCRGKLRVGTLEWIKGNVPRHHLDPYPRDNFCCTAKYRSFFSRERLNAFRDGGQFAKSPAARALGFWRFVVLAATEYNALNILVWAAANLSGEYVVCPETWLCVEKDDDEDAVLARLQWWKNSGIPLNLVVHDRALAAATELGFTKVAAWLRDADIPSTA